MKGCNNRSDCSNTESRRARANVLSGVASSAATSAFVSSMYQSQSRPRKMVERLHGFVKLVISSALRTSRAVLFRRETIQRSCSAGFSRSTSALSDRLRRLRNSSGRSERHSNLVGKVTVRLDLPFHSSAYRWFRPGQGQARSIDAELIKTSSGSTPFIFVFDIRWPCLSRIVPVTYTSANGSLATNFSPS